MTTQTDLGVRDPFHGSGFITVRCPADGRVVGTVPDMTPGEVHEVAQQLRGAQPAWEDLGPHGRAKHVLRLLDWVLDNEKRLIGLMQEETGKSWGDAQLETAVLVDTVNYFTKHAAEFLADRIVKRARPQGQDFRGVNTLSRVSIDPAKCQGHGRCVLIAPAYFDMDDSGFGVVLRDGVETTDKADIDEAVLSCPEHAVEVE